MRGEPDAVALARDLYGRRAERIDVAARAGDQHCDVEGRQGSPRLRFCRDLPRLLLGGSTAFYSRRALLPRRDEVHHDPDDAAQRSKEQGEED